MSDLKDYVDSILSMVSNPYGGLAILAALSLWKWHTTDRELKKCQDDHAETRNDNSKLHAAVDGLYEAVCFLVEPMGYRVLPLEFIKRGDRPVLHQERRTSDRNAEKRAHALPVTCDRTL